MSFEEKTVNGIISFIKDYFNKNKLKGVVIGISGGKDSAVVATLFTKALGSNNVEGVWMPCNSSKEDYLDAKLLCNKLNINLNEFELSNIYHEFNHNVKDISLECLGDANINLKPRLRMTSLYYLASIFSKIKNGNYIVAGTSNKSELYVGYFTKGGDNSCDIEILSDLTVSEVIKIGEYLNIPDKIIHKVPNDGLSNKTDEEKMGVTYHDIDLVINNQSSLISKDSKNKIAKLHKNNLHKFRRAKYRKDK